jgi:hypothetical protein
MEKEKNRTIKSLTEESLNNLQEKDYKIDDLQT